MIFGFKNGLNFYGFQVWKEKIFFRAYFFFSFRFKIFLLSGDSNIFFLWQLPIEIKLSQQKFYFHFHILYSLIYRFTLYKTLIVKIKFRMSVWKPMEIFSCNGLTKSVFFSQFRVPIFTGVHVGFRPAFKSVLTSWFKHT